MYNRDEKRVLLVVASLASFLVPYTVSSFSIALPAIGEAFSLDAVTLGTSWSRIEAGWHFPSDTLVSASLGAFFAQFYDDAFLHAGETKVPTAGLQWQEGGAILTVLWIF